MLNVSLIQLGSSYINKFSSIAGQCRYWGWEVKMGKNEENEEKQEGT